MRLATKVFRRYIFRRSTKKTNKRTTIAMKCNREMLLFHIQTTSPIKDFPICYMFICYGYIFKWNATKNFGFAFRAFALHRFTVILWQVNNIDSPPHILGDIINKFTIHFQRNMHCSSGWGLLS